MAKLDVFDWFFQSIQLFFKLYIYLNYQKNVLIITFGEQACLEKTCHTLCILQNRGRPVRGLFEKFVEFSCVIYIICYLFVNFNI